LITLHKTSLGEIVRGDSLEVLADYRGKSVDLIMTSPPFGLVRKKDYGNVAADEYVEWFKPFAAAFRGILKDSGSLVIDIGGAWNKGYPTRNLYHFKLLIMLCEEFGFHLAQDFYWWNPSKLPTPAEWVTVRRVRVKDAINTIPNTDSNSFYLRYCEKNGFKPHPARYPAELPEYFIRMLTEPGDLVVDPFAGSCVTGMVCEQIKRRWVCIELVREYCEAAKGRFVQDRRAASNAASDPENPANYYRVPRPGILWNDEPGDRLPRDGGKKRPAKSK